MHTDLRPAGLEHCADLQGRSAAALHPGRRRCLVQPAAIRDGGARHARRTEPAGPCDPTGGAAMKRLFPAPLLSLAVWLLWLLLNLSISPGNLLLGAVLGFCAPLMMRRLRPLPVRIR